MEFPPPPPAAALLNGDIQIYKWVWWRSRLRKIISSFAINERNSWRALCPLQTQFSNEKRCAPSFPPTTTPIHLSSAHPCELWGIHSFKCWPQDWDACLVNYFQNQRMRRRDLFWGRTCRAWQFPHSAPYVLLLKTDVSENQNKQNNGVHIDICAADLLLICRIWVDAQFRCSQWFKQQYLSYIKAFLFYSGRRSIYGYIYTRKSFYDDVFLLCDTNKPHPVWEFLPYLLDINMILQPALFLLVCFGVCGSVTVNVISFSVIAIYFLLVAGHPS